MSDEGDSCKDINWKLVMLLTVIHISGWDVANIYGCLDQCSVLPCERSLLRTTPYPLPYYIDLRGATILTFAVAGEH